MGQSAEHDVAHLFELIFYRGVERGMVVAMYYAPPRRHAVDKSGSVGQDDLRPLCVVHDVGREWVMSACIRMPQVGAVKPIMVCRLRAYLLSFADVISSS